MRKIDYSEIPEADVVINHIKMRKLQKKQHTLTFVAGLGGTGKSSTCLRLAERASIELEGENKVTEKNIIDSLLKLIELVKNANPEEVHIGVIEEVSVLFAARRAMSGENVDVNAILDTARKKQVILFANAPLWPSIDPHMRAMGNIYIETLRINKTQKVVISKALKLQTNPRTGKTYWHRFQREGRDVHRIYTKMPNQDTWENYEKGKDAFMDRLYDKLKMRELKRNEKLQKELGIKPIKVVRPLSPQEIKVYDLVERQGMKQIEAGDVLGISSSRMTRIMQNIRKKLQIVRENAPIEEKKRIKKL
jgi:predicted DNA-binding protein (UPF0251 family)